MAAKKKIQPYTIVNPDSERLAELSQQKQAIETEINILLWPKGLRDQIIERKKNRDA